MRCAQSKWGHKGCIRRERHAKRRPLAPVRGLRGAAGVLSAALLTSLVGISAIPAAAATCGSLARLGLPDTTITAAQSVAAGTYTAPDGEIFTNLPAFCRVAATLTPTADSNIKIEVWMPYSGWSGRFLGTGNGGIAGLILWRTLAHFLPLNYAVASTDMGTSPAATDPLGGRVLTGHPEKQIDFATRSTNLMTVRSKQIVEAFYSERPRHSYFLGCSTGGGQGVHEALQFPGDYDGIVAGAPLFNNTHHTAANIWDYQAFNSSPANITADQASAITAAAVKQCVRKDGGLSSDNFLTDPRDCRWDPAALQCTGGAADATTCLTLPQVAAVRKLYEGPINPRTGERILAGRVRGSESNNGYPAVLASRPGSTNTLTYWVFGNDFNVLNFDFDHDMDTLDDEQAARSNANTADLEEFKSHGGKLIIMHGFADPLVPTSNTVAYYERLIASQAREGRHDEEERKGALRRTQKFARLFLLPGVGHCSGGAGPDTVEGDPTMSGPNDPVPHIAGLALDPLEQWVEHGIAPDQIIAYKVTNGVTAFSRPVCPYPALPRYSGVGDTTKASSFTCIADRDRDDNQPPAPKYLNDGDNYPIVPIDDRDRDHDHDNR
jgi:feruloyl esterase